MKKGTNLFQSLINMLPLTSILQMLFSHPVHQTKDLLVDGRQADQKPSAALEKRNSL